MKFRKAWLTVVVTAVAVIAAACGGSTPTTTNPADQTGTLTIWLMNGSAPQRVVDGVNADFKAKYPKVTVNVEIQQWGEIGTKLDTAFAGSTPPDVVELGNTLVAKYAAAGALEDISGKKSSFDNSGTWLQSLTDSCTVSGKLYCVPYLAGSRAIIYRKDFFAAAGVTPPTSMDDLLTVGQKLMNAHKSDPNFSALYFPGKYWYAALPFIWQEGGDIAVQDGGSWKGTLSSAASVKGLDMVKKIMDEASGAPKDGDESKDYVAFCNGEVGMLMGPGWKLGQILNEKDGCPAMADKVGAFALPGAAAGTTAPAFLGGSNLAISAKSEHQDLALDLLKIMAGKGYQTQFAQAGTIPALKSLLGQVSGDEAAKAQAVAAQNSRFVPSSENWAGVEASTVLPDMLVSIAQGGDVQAAATQADQAITSQLNG